MAYTTINKGSLYMNTVLYTGNDTSQSITGVGFQPDWTWIKCRSNNENHALYDSVRGATKHLISNLTNAEVTRANGLTAFNSDGFSVGSENDVNDGSQTFASWNWLAGGTASSNTDGDITSSVSVNTTSGFSVVSYTGNSTTDSNFTVGHGLSQTPGMVIIKNRDWASSSKGWAVWHSAISTGGVFLDSTEASESNNFNYYFGSQPTSSTFSIRADTTVSTGNRYKTNGQGDDYIAYCFAEKQGFSKFGSYTGNGSTSGDGTFVYTGFKPAFVMVRRTNSSLWGWVMIDNKRSTPSGNNLIDKSLLANADAVDYAPGSGWVADFLSNGFKFRMTANHSAANGNGDPYIYMAFAENPFVGSDGTPVTAR